MQNFWPAISEVFSNEDFFFFAVVEAFFMLPIWCEFDKDRPSFATDFLSQMVWLANVIRGKSNTDVFSMVDNDICNVPICSLTSFEENLRLLHREYCSSSSSSFSTFSLSCILSAFMSRTFVFRIETSSLRATISSPRDFSSEEMASRNMFWETVLICWSVKRERKISASSDMFSFL